MGPPLFTFCENTDEEYAPPDNSVGSAGCQRPQYPYSVRLHWEEPVDTGYGDGSPVTVTGYLIQWSLDETFAIGTSSSYQQGSSSWGCNTGASWDSVGVSQDTCIDEDPAKSIEAGDICIFNWRVADIPAAIRTRPSSSTNNIWEKAVAATLEQKNNVESCDNSGLLQRTRYYVRMAAISEVGVGTFSDAYLSHVVLGQTDTPIVTSTSILPDTPDSDEHRFHISWDQPTDTGDGTAGAPFYEIHLRVSRDAEGIDELGTVTRDVFFEDAEYTWLPNSDFTPVAGGYTRANMEGKVYYLTIVGQNRHGISAPTVVIINSPSPCVAGYYGESCIPCPRGTTSQIGAETKDDCLCIPGWFRDDGICVPCPMGSYKLGLGDGVCTNCSDV